MKVVMFAPVFLEEYAELKQVLFIGEGLLDDIPERPSLHSNYWD